MPAIDKYELVPQRLWRYLSAHRGIRHCLECSCAGSKSATATAELRGLHEFSGVFVQCLLCVCSSHLRKSHKCKCSRGRHHFRGIAELFDLATYIICRTYL